MSRRKTEINPLRAERLKKLIEESGLTQTAFSNKVHYSQQLISHIINKKVALTEGTAKDILSYYPKYRFNWLMGYDDYMTEDDLLNGEIGRLKSRNDLMHNGIYSFLQLIGCNLEETFNFSLQDCKEASAEEITNRITNAGYIINYDGKSISMSLDEFNSFTREISDYIAFRLQHMMK